MSSNELGGYLSYVVSRSGKVLDSKGRVLPEMFPGNVQDLSHAEPLASMKEQPPSFFNLAALLTPLHKEAMPRTNTTTTKKRKYDQLANPRPTSNQRTLVWVDEITSSVDDIARAILRRQRRVFRRSSRKKQVSDVRGSDNSSDRHHRLVQHLRTGISQMAILQRWQSGSRELSAKWASWLLKMLRKSKPPPQSLQRFLFTVLGAVLPVISCGLICQTLSILPDSEVLRAVDILCSALEKSWFYFSPFQWEILEERMYMCQQVRMKAGTWLERKGVTQANVPLLSTESNRISASPERSVFSAKGLAGGGGKQKHRRVDCQSLSSSSDDYAIDNDERMSNQLVRSEGVKSLVRRALRERQIFTFKRSQGSCMSNSHHGGGTSVSLMCSLSKRRIKVPARGICCTHMTCFDLECYLEMNAEAVSSKRDKLHTSIWRCPYCGADTSWPQIIVDGFLLRILKSLSGDVLEVLVWPDGRWSAMEPSIPQSVEDEVRHSQGEEKGVLSKKARVCAGSGDDTRGEVYREEVSKLGNLSGNEASGVRGMVDVSKSESNLCGVDAQEIASKSRNAPALHEINLQGLIQSTLEKAKGCSLES